MYRWQQKHGVFSFMAIVVVSLIVGVWHYVAAPYADDFPYMLTVPDTGPDDFWNGYGSRIETFDDAIYSIIPHYINVNGRLTNILMILSVPMSRWVSCLIDGLFTGAMLWLLMLNVMRLSGRRAGAWVTMLVAIIIWKWFPWSDNMVSRDFFLNYVTPSVLVLFYGIFFFSRPQKQSIIWISLVVSLFTGLFHEGFSLPLVASSCIVTLCYKKDRQWRMMLTFILIVGVCISVFSPSTINRLAEREYETGLGPTTVSFARGVLKCFPLYIVIFLTIVAAVKKRIIEIFSNAGIVFWIISGITGIFIAVVFQGAGRFFWMTDLALLIVSLVILMNLFPIFLRQKPKIAIGLGLLLVAFGVILVLEQADVSRGQWKLLRELRDRGDGIVFVDLKLQSDIPWWVWQMPHQYSDLKTVKLLGMGMCGYHGDRIPLILPTDLADKEFNAWYKLPGNNPLRGGNGYWYSDKCFPENTEIVAKFGEITPSAIPFRHSIPDTIISYLGKSAYAITAKSDTVWRYDLDLPFYRRLVSLDFK